MSLKAFHLFFIVASILLSAYFGGWCLQEYSDSQNRGIFLLSIASFISTTFLVAYLGWFLKKSKGISFMSFALWVSISLLTIPQSGSACPVCIGNPNSPLVKSANAGVLFLLVVVSGLLVAIGGLMVYWTKRARKLNVSSPS